jgi:hypothetical protein
VLLVEAVPLFLLLLPLPLLLPLLLLPAYLAVDDADECICLFSAWRASAMA